MALANRHVATELGLLGLAAIWGVNFVVVKEVLNALDPLSLNALRFALAAAALWFLVRGSTGPGLDPRDRARLAAVGVLGHVGYQVAFILGVNGTLAGNASLLLATAPVWTVLLSAAVGHERLNTTVVSGCAATLIGMALVVAGRGDDIGISRGTLEGDALMVLSAVLWSTYTVGASPLVSRYGALRVTAWTVWIGTPILLLMGAPSISRIAWGEVPAGAWAGVAYSGILSVAVAYLLWYRGVERLGNARTAVYSNSVPVVALLAAWAWLGEIPTPFQLLGAAVILAGITIARVGGPGQPGPSSLRWRTSGNS
jgi:drug/metabolite transporter (DMT)-like permease